MIFQPALPTERQQIHLPDACRGWEHPYSIMASCEFTELQMALVAVLHSGPPVCSLHSVQRAILNKANLQLQAIGAYGECGRSYMALKCMYRLNISQYFYNSWEWEMPQCESIWLSFFAVWQCNMFSTTGLRQEFFWQFAWGSLGENQQGNIDHSPPLLCCAILELPHRLLTSLAGFLQSSDLWPFWLAGSRQRHSRTHAGVHSF